MKLIDSMRNLRGRSVASTVAGLALVAGSVANSADATESPNFLVITVDDLKRVIGVMADRPGNLLHQIYPDSVTRNAIKSILTPNIDQLANNGVLFTNAYAVAPVCNPSRISIATGTRPDLTGFTTNKVLFRDEPGGASLITMTQNLRNQGYFATGVGKIFHSNKVVLAADGQTIVKDWPDTQYSWDQWINRAVGHGGNISYSPYSTSNGKIRFGSVDLGLTSQNDYINADYVADLLADGTATFYDATYNQNVTVNLPVDAPFYIGLGVYLPHQPFVAPQDILSLFDPADMQLDTSDLQAIQNDLLDLSAGGQYVTGGDGQITSEFQVLLQRGINADGPGGDVNAWKEVIRHYLASVVVADRAIGVALDALNTSAYKDNTVVVLHSDHGFNLGEKNRLDKNDVWDESTGSVLIIDGPSMPANVIENSVSLLDIYPTVSALAGVTNPAHVMGNDLSPYLGGSPSVHWSKPSFTTQGSTANRHAVRTDSYRYVRFYDDPANAELYDLRIDPDELTNLIDSPSYLPVRTALDSLMDDIRNNSVSAPAMVQLNDVDSADGAPIDLKVEAWQAGGEEVTYSATELPAGLVIDPASGVIEGNATGTGVYFPTVQASSLAGASSVSFVWTVGAGESSDPPGWTDATLDISAVTENSVSLNWSGATDDIAVVGYVLSYDSVTEALTAAQTTVSGLQASTSYQFTVQAIDADGQASSDGPTVTAITSDVADTQAPDWTNATLQSSAITADSFTINWSGASDNIGVVNYRVEISGGLSPLVVETPLTSIQVVSLESDTSYQVTVEAEDDSGNASIDGPSIVFTTSINDVEAPQWPINTELTTQVDANSIFVTWPEATDNVAVTEYEIFLNGNSAGVAVEPSYVFDQLTPETIYSIEVYARDGAGNTSPVPLTATVTTLIYVDNQMRFSTVSSASMAGIGGIPDDAHIYTWEGDGASITLNAASVGLPRSADIDALSVVSENQFFISSNASIADVLGIGFVMTDRDIIEYNNGVWSLYLAGADMGLTAASHDIDALSIKGNTVYLSIIGAVSVSNLGIVDDADIFKWNGSELTKIWDGSDAGLPPLADIDALEVRAENHFFMSFNATTTLVPGLGAVSDEDIVEYNDGAWSLFFDGSDGGLIRSGHDIDAVSIGISSPPEADTDAPFWNNAQISQESVTAESAVLSWSGAQDNIAVSGYTVTYSDGATEVVVQTSDSMLSVSGLTAETSYVFSVVAFDAAGNTSAVSVSTTVVTAMAETNGIGALYLSILGNSALPGVSGADDADIYQHNASVFDKIWDASADGGFSGGADIDGFAVLGDMHFLLSFTASNTNVPGFGFVRDEDIVEYNNGNWSLFFDGSVYGLNGGGHDIDALSLHDSVLYFSTVSSAKVSGISQPDDADIYSWNGSTIDRVFDGSAAGLVNSADIDALSVLAPDHYLMSFNATSLNISDLGAVKDEDVVEYKNGTWTMFFQGADFGLTSGGHDIDGISSYLNQ